MLDVFDRQRDVIILSGSCLAVFLWLVLLCGCSDRSSESNGESKAVYRQITPAQAKKELGLGQPIILLDVRTEAENRALRIPGSVLLPLDKLEQLASERLPDKNARIFVYCRSGNRSNTASRKLIDLGYTNIFDLGGIIDWPYETEHDE